MALTSKDAATLNDKEFFFTALKQYISETLFYGLCAVIIFLAAKLSWWLSFMLFLPYSALGIVGLFQSIVLLPSVVSGTVTYFHLRKFGTDAERKMILGTQDPVDQLFVLGTSIISVVRSLLFVSFSIWLLIFLFLE